MKAMHIKRCAIEVHQTIFFIVYSLYHSTEQIESLLLPMQLRGYYVYLEHSVAVTMEKYL